MRINTNVSANSALTNLNKVQDSIGGSMQKLSSGFRINKAGDDAAGLGIANQMNADIKAMSQASRNAEQAGSVLQIMDGAAQNVQSILERMKELAAQSASDTVDSGARTKINSEFGSLSDELDRIVATTKFQGAALLNGSFGSKSTNIGTIKTAASTFIGGDVSGVTVTAANIYNKFATVNAAVSVIGQTAPASVAGVTGANITVNSQSLVDTLTSAPIVLATTLTATAAAGSATNGIAVAAGNTATSISATSSSVAGQYTLTVAAGADATHTNFTLTGPGGYSSLVSVTDGDASAAFTGGISIGLHAGKTQSDYVTDLSGKKLDVKQTYRVDVTGGGVTGGDTATIVDDGNAKNAVFTNYGLTLAVPTVSAASLNGKTIDLTEKLQLTLTGTSSQTGSAVTQSVAIPATNASQQLTFGSFGLRVDFSAGATTQTFKSAVNTAGHSAIIQDGSRQAQFLVSSSQSYTGNDLISLDTVDLTVATLGVTKTSVDLTSGAGAQAALSTIDTAISRVGTALGAIGAAENRIMYANQNVKTAIQNFTAAKSAIKDVDMADEMTTFSKNQILSQAGTAMLAQANQLGQSVLKLLQ